VLLYFNPKSEEAKSHSGLNVAKTVSAITTKDAFPDIPQ